MFHINSHCIGAVPTRGSRSLGRAVPGQEGKSHTNILICTGLPMQGAWQLLQPSGSERRLSVLCGFLFSLLREPQENAENQNVTQK